jgi:threonine/homoserine/homoserine lactone efflux protein
MIEILGKGVAVGLAVAAPVGPIGILCIRRTLLEGRPAGLASGLGAASADALYGIMVATGLAATGILVSYAGPMEIGGGFLIAGLGASAASDPTAPYWLVLGVFLGSALWWLFLVHLVLAARGRLSASTTRWLDLVSGGVLLIWGLLIVANRL